MTLGSGESVHVVTVVNVRKGGVLSTARASDYTHPGSAMEVARWQLDRLLESLLPSSPPRPAAPRPVTLGLLPEPSQGPVPAPAPRPALDAELPAGI
jgi:hypothetical protein